MQTEKARTTPKITSKVVLKQKDAPTYSGLHCIETLPDEVAQKIRYQANLIKVQARDFRTVLKIITLVPIIIKGINIDITSDKLSSIAIRFEKILKFHNSMRSLWEKLWEQKNYIFLIDSFGHKQSLESRLKEIIDKTRGIINHPHENVAIRETRIKILRLLLQKTYEECLEKLNALK